MARHNLAEREKMKKVKQPNWFVVLDKLSSEPLTDGNDPIYSLTRKFAKMAISFKGKKGRKYKILTWAKRLCPKCGDPLFRSFINGYTYQCFSCDEDFYKIET